MEKRDRNSTSQDGRKTKEEPGRLRDAEEEPDNKMGGRSGVNPEEGPDNKMDGRPGVNLEEEPDGKMDGRSGTLADDELDNVSGGSCRITNWGFHTDKIKAGENVVLSGGRCCPYCSGISAKMIQSVPYSNGKDIISAYFICDQCKSTFYLGGISSENGKNMLRR